MMRAMMQNHNTAEMQLFLIYMYLSTMRKCEDMESILNARGDIRAALCVVELQLSNILKNRKRMMYMAQRSV